MVQTVFLSVLLLVFYRLVSFVGLFVTAFAVRVPPNFATAGSSVSFAHCNSGFDE
jgi:hypothetical protein